MLPITNATDMKKPSFRPGSFVSFCIKRPVRSRARI
jgi:hypothetical protein